MRGRHWTSTRPLPRLRGQQLAPARPGRPWTRRSRGGTWTPPANRPPTATPNRPADQPAVPPGLDGVRVAEGVQLAVAAHVVVVDPAPSREGSAQPATTSSNAVSTRVSNRRRERASERDSWTARAEDPARVGREPAEDVAAADPGRHGEHAGAVPVQQHRRRQRAPDGDEVLAVGGALGRLGAARRPGRGPVAGRHALGAGAGAQWNESPQAQEPPALGLSIWKPCFSIVSAKSTVAPAR